MRRHQAGRCCYCRCPFNTDDSTSDYAMTRDHVVPRSKGGKQKNNIVYACRRCNQEKGALSVAEFRAALRHSKDHPHDLPN